jgi:hypothetical protein
METSIQPLDTNSDNTAFFRKRYNPTIALAVGILLFLLPFATIKCGNVTVGQNTGIGLATGADWKVSFMGMDNNLLKDLGNKTEPGKEKEINSGVNWYVLLALVFAACGLVFTIANWKMKALAAMCAASLGAVMLVAAFIHLKLYMRSQIPTGNEADSLNMNMSGLIKVQFTPWYFLAFAAFVAAAFFSFKHNRIEMEDALRAAHEFDFQKRAAEDPKNKEERQVE